MRSIFLIAWNDLRLLLQERAVLINMFLISTVMVVVVGLANGSFSGGGATPKLVVDVIDRDASALSAEFMANLRDANPALVLCPMDNDADDVCDLEGTGFDDETAQTRLTGQTSLALIVLPEGFQEDIYAGQSVTIEYRSNEDASAPSYILQAVQAVTRRMSGTLVARRAARELAADPQGLALPEAGAEEFAQDVENRSEKIWSADPITVSYHETVKVEGPSAIQRGMGQSVPGMGGMYVMFAVFPAMAALVRDREAWTLQRLLVAPVRGGEVLGGKMLARFCLGMIQYGLSFALGALIGVSYGDDLLAVVLIMALFVAAVTALTLTLATFIKSEAQGSGLALFLTLTLAPLGGAWWPISIVPPFMRTLAMATPVYWAMQGFQSLIYMNGSLSTVIVPIAALAGMAVVFYTIGALRFRYEG